MKHKKTKLVVILLAFGLLGVQAQQAILATGGNGDGSGGTVCYSVGQLVYHTIAGTNGTVTEGVQQPLEILEVGIENNLENDIDITAYPNPVIQKLFLRVGKEFRTGSMRYQLFDIQGVLLSNRVVNGNETMIDLSAYEPSSYIIRVMQEEKEIKSFIIIKQ